MNEYGRQRNANKIKRLLENSKKIHNEILPNGKKSYGYHTIVLNEEILHGQRRPQERLDLVDYDFSGKKILDIGSNQGGMMFVVADKIQYGLGIDHNPKYVNVSNKISRYNNYNCEFYYHDLDNDNLSAINDYSSVDSFDVVFLCAVCCHIKNWKEVIDWVYENSQHCLFESNGSDIEQQEQWLHLMTTFNSVELLSSQSTDDYYQKNRKLYWCTV